VAAAYAERGIGIAAVLAQRCDRIAAAAERAGVSFPFPVLCDPDRDVIKAYGVWHPLGLDAFNTAHPASFLIDARRARIRYAFVGRNQFARAPLSEILRRAETVE
jgi:peroxiredoxin